MTVNIKGHAFSGYYTVTSSLPSAAGVYVILCLRDSKHYVIDVGESEDIRDRVDNHDRKDCWKRNCSGTLEYAYLTESDEEKRKTIEKAIREHYNPPCGKR